MLKLIKNYYPIIIGALSGYLYYRYIGCLNGSCPITGNPFISTIYGALIGSILVFDKFKKRKRDKA
jgi:hypothetical protein